MSSTVCERSDILLGGTNSPNPSKVSPTGEHRVLCTRNLSAEATLNQRRYSLLSNRDALYPQSVCAVLAKSAPIQMRPIDEPPVSGPGEWEEAYFRPQEPESLAPRLDMTVNAGPAANTKTPTPFCSGQPQEGKTSPIIRKRPPLSNIILRSHVIDAGVHNKLLPTPSVSAANLATPSSSLLLHIITHLFGR
ncbi:uncharacterized protein EI90DRAFT_3096711 [Cantharellus anzutake]|uniref:uncharacterized protein n=1 Tax=Cantharellus anzutake TaxID=1750568 RepID=UPI0019079F64|nr:uncharacterized protein EI90DRAFT_3096711 [Cantharellus anzutake]KAF8311417.1 hypothetical protein EI90DRAFT_3096711 [Cantharellus anzutake]